MGKEGEDLKVEIKIDPACAEPTVTVTAPPSPRRSGPWSGAFVRISHSEIVNLKQVTALDLSLAGTIKMTLAGGAAVCWVSRRYVPRIRQALGLGRGRRA